MEPSIVIAYSFALQDGRTRECSLALDPVSLRLRVDPPASPPEWTALGYCRCANCSLDPLTRHCPAALALAAIIGEFSDLFSYENATVTVTTDERLYRRETTIQQGLGSLVGIVMAGSGCPVLDRMRPLIRFHLPFASLQETAFRMVALHFLAQHLRERQGLSAAWPLGKIETMYAEVGQTNRDFAERIRGAAARDAHLNALVCLDCFASMVPLALDDILDALTPSFSAWLS